MDSAAKIALLREIATGLEAGEQSPVTPLVRKAIRLAAALGEGEYLTLFQLHLDGIDLHSKGRVAPLKDRDPERARSVMKALFADRAVGDKGLLSAHSLPVTEQMIDELRAVDTTGRTLEQRFQLQQVVNRIRSRLGVFVIEVEPRTSGDSSAEQPAHKISPPPKIFIGHGRSSAWHELRDFLSSTLHLEWDEFNREATAGLTVTERLEEMLRTATFAFLVMTAEEEHADASLHARPNVIHEIGLCQGSLGRRKAIVMLETGCAEFSNIVGLGQIRFDRGNLIAKADQIVAVLKREGVI